MNTLESYEVQEVVEELLSDILVIRDRKNEIEENFDMAVDAGNKVKEARYEYELNHIHAKLKVKIAGLKSIIDSL